MTCIIERVAKEILILLIIVENIMRSKYCPYCGSTKIHTVDENPQIGQAEVEPIYECEDCQEHWRQTESKSTKAHPDSV